MNNPFIFDVGFVSYFVLYSKIEKSFCWLLVWEGVKLDMTWMMNVDFSFQSIWKVLTLSFLFLNSLFIHSSSLLANSSSFECKLIRYSRSMMNMFDNSSIIIIDGSNDPFYTHFFYWDSQSSFFYVWMLSEQHSSPIQWNYYDTTYSDSMNQMAEE